MKIVGSRIDICSAEGVRRGGSAGRDPQNELAPGGGGGGVQLDFQMPPIGRQNETPNGAKMVPTMEPKVELEIHSFLVFNFRMVTAWDPKIDFSPMGLGTG